jgi:Sec-independent protein translocase protein TatA
MFGLGFWETVIIIVVALVMIKPEKLPGFFRKAGQLVGKAQSAYETLRRLLHQMDQPVHPPALSKTEPAQSVPSSAPSAVKRKADEWHPDGTDPYPELRGQVRRTGPKPGKRKKKRKRILKEDIP